MNKWLVAVVLFLLIRKKVLVWFRKQQLQIRVLHSNRSLLGSSRLDFDNVLKAFRSNFLDGREKGSQLTITLDGEVALDVQGGRDEASVFTGLTMLFSSSKVIESLVTAQLVEQGKLKYEDPIALHWPEFGSKFSNSHTVADLMRHRTGLAGIYKQLSCEEAEEIFNSPQKTERWVLDTLQMDEDVQQRHDPPSCARYHALTRGIILSVLIHRVDGRDARTYVKEEIVEPVRKAREDRKQDHKQELEYSVGCPDEWQSRMAVTEATMPLALTAAQLVAQLSGLVDLFFHPGEDAMQHELDDHFHYFFKPSELAQMLQVANPFSLHRKSLGLVHDVTLDSHFLANSPEFRKLPLLSVTGCSNSYSVACITSELACGGGCLLSAKGLEEAMRVDCRLLDELVGLEFTMTNCGWGADRFGDDWIGWAGAGGGYVVVSLGSSIHMNATNSVTESMSSLQDTKHPSVTSLQSSKGGSTKPTGTGSCEKSPNCFKHLLPSKAQTK